MICRRVTRNNCFRTLSQGPSRSLLPFGRDMGSEFLDGCGLVDLCPVPLMRRHGILKVYAFFRRTTNTEE
jgi:hypothetical protein